FFKPPGTERLYSGVTKSSASAAAICWRNVSHAAGGLSSRSWLYSGSSPISTALICSAAGDMAISAFAILRFSEPLRRLPTRTATLCCCAMHDSLEIHHPIEAPRDADERRDLANRQQRAVDIR